MRSYTGYTEGVGHGILVKRNNKNNIDGEFTLCAQKGLYHSQQLVVSCKSATGTINCNLLVREVLHAS